MDEREVGKADNGRKKPGEIALKIGVVGAIGVGAVLSGLFISRRGRHLLREAWQGRRRSRLEDRVLDTLWGDPVLGRRDIEVKESPEGTVVLSGMVRSERERRVALALAADVTGVENVADQLSVEPRTRSTAMRRRRAAEPD
jgi:hypothetical protein